MLVSSHLIYGKQPDFTRPVLFLDFDTVVNVFGEARDKPDVQIERLYVPDTSDENVNLAIPSGDDGRSIEVAWRPDVADVLRNLNAVWLTSWKAFSQNVLNPALGFDFGYVDWYYRGFSDGGYYGKTSAIQTILRECRPPACAVADDCFCFGEESLAFIFPALPFLVKAPVNGLSVEDAIQLETFLSSDYDPPSYWACTLDDLRDECYSGIVYVVHLVDANALNRDNDIPLFAGERRWRFKTREEGEAFIAESESWMWGYASIPWQNGQNVWGISMSAEVWERGAIVEDAVSIAGVIKMVDLR